MTDDCFAGLKPQKGVVDADGVRINYYDWGQDGPDVVMIHGITSSALSWWRVAPELARSGYKVTALDMPGHGDSEDPNISYTLSKTAHIVDAFMAALGIAAPIIVGHSWGGGVTLTHATDPDMVVVPHSIVLVDPLIRMPIDPESQYRDALLKLLGAPRQKLAPMLRDAYPKWHDCDVYWKAEALEKAAPSALNGVFAENAGLDQVFRLQNVPGPWCLLVAEPAQGGLLPRSMWPELEKAAQENDGGVRYMPGVPHDVHREDFEGFLALLNDFLSGVG